MNRETILNLMETLALRRPIFHSEADFQFELAWQLKLLHEVYNIRLEYPIPRDNRINRGHMDIRVQLGNEITGIELKYLTREFRNQVSDEQFDLRPDNRVRGENGYIDRYNNDVLSLRGLIQAQTITQGFGIMLTSVQLLRNEMQWGDWINYSNVLDTFNNNHCYQYNIVECP